MGKKEIGQILGGGLGGLIAQEPLAAISPLAGYLKRVKDKKESALDRIKQTPMEQVSGREGFGSGSVAMRNGGVTKSRPIDGKAIRGKTRGRKI